MSPGLSLLSAPWIDMGSERVIILGDADWGAVRDAPRLFSPGTYVVAADGGYRQAVDRGIRVDVVIGDLDSVGEALRTSLLNGEGPPVRRYREDKDWTDLELALGCALEQQPREIIVLGGFGTRIDHSLTNLHLLEQGLRAGVAVRLIRGRETVWLTDHEVELQEAEIGERISLVPHSSEVRVSTEGLRFALDGDTLRRSASRGVSNEVSDRPVRVSVHEGLLFIIHHAGEE